MPDQQTIDDEFEKSEIERRLAELELKVNQYEQGGFDIFRQFGYLQLGDALPRLDKDAITFIAKDSGNALTAPPDSTKIAWRRDGFLGALIADILAGYATPTTLSINSLWSRVMHTDADSISDNSIGIWDENLSDWLSRLAIYDGPYPMVHTRDGDVTTFRLEKVDASNYKLMIMKAGTLVEIGAGSLKTANTGQFLIPAGPSAGNWVRSGSADAYGSWYPLPIGDAVAPAAATETVNNASVLMPPTVAAGDLLIVLAAAHTGNTVGTGSGFTQLGTGTNTINLKVFYKVAAGTEGGTSVSFTNCDVAQVYRILAANYVGVPTISTAATGTSTTANPTAVTPAASRFLSIVVAAVQGDSTVNVTASPAGYSTIDNIQEGAASDVGGVSMGSAYLVDSGVSEDPGTFTNGSNPWVAFAIAIAASNAVIEATYITDLALEVSGSPTYAQVQIGTGEVGAESAIGTYKLTPSDWTLQCGAVVPVAISTRLSARIATSAAAADHFLTLGMLNQDDVA